jgi:hypothetical protein
MLPAADEVTRHAPGVFGSLAAMLWIRDTWPRRIGYMVAGAISSHYAAPWVAQWTGIDLALAGFLVGLFGLAIVAKVFETLESIKPAELGERILRRWGL